jgi:hypothetical protein
MRGFMLEAVFHMMLECDCGMRRLEDQGSLRLTEKKPEGLELDLVDSQVEENEMEVIRQHSHSRDQEEDAVLAAPPLDTDQMTSIVGQKEATIPTVVTQEYSSKFPLCAGA